MNSLIVFVGLLALSSAAVLREKRQFSQYDQGQGQSSAPSNGQPEQYQLPPAGYNNPLYKVKVPITYTFAIQNPMQRPASFLPYYGDNSNAGYYPGASFGYNNAGPQYSPELSGNSRAWANVGSTFPLYAQKPYQYETDSWDVGSLNKNWGSKTRTNGIVERVNGY